MRIKLQAVRTYLAGPSLRATCGLFRYECPFSHEALRQWVARIGHHLRINKTSSKLVVIDETSLFTQTGEEVFGWVALCGKTKRVVFSWVTTGRSSLDALIFIKNVLRRCRARPHFMVDRGVWYPWALDTLNLSWNVQCGGPRNHVENYFGSFKHRLRRMIRRPGTWHTPTSYQALLDAYGFSWNDRLS